MSFSDSATVVRYTDGPVKQIPGFRALQQMAGLLLAERVPEDGEILVLGAGGGLELKAFAETYPGWRFLGVDPSAHMLALAQQTLGPHSARVELLQGYIDDTSETVFDGATCLLVMHFLTAEQRLHTLRELKRRLKPGAPLIIAHHSFPVADPGEKRRWLSRYAAYATLSGIVDVDAQRAIAAIDARLTLLSPDEDVALLTEAGFEAVELFYAGLTFRGWVASAPSSAR